MGRMRALVGAAGAPFVALTGGQPAPADSFQRLLQRAEASAPLRVLVGASFAEPYDPENELDVGQLAALPCRVAVARDQLGERIVEPGCQTRARYGFLSCEDAQIEAQPPGEPMASSLVASSSKDRMREPKPLRRTALTGQTTLCAFKPVSVQQCVLGAQASGRVVAAEALEQLGRRSL